MELHGTHLSYTGNELDLTCKHSFHRDVTGGASAMVLPCICGSNIHHSGYLPRANT